MMKVLVTDKIAESAISLLRKEVSVDYAELSRDELLDKIGEYHGLIVRSRTRVDADVINRAVNLRVIGRAGIGVDNIDVDAATKKGIYVVNAPRSSTYSVAELTMGLMIALARGITKADVSMKAGLWEKKRLVGVELYEKTLGIVGFGRIGREVAKRAKSFGMRVIAYDPYAPNDLFSELGVERKELDNLLAEADFVTIHAILTPETRGLINREKIEIMRDGAYLINCARGGIVDEGALYDALKSGKLAGAALDVYEVEPPTNSPLLGLDNIILTPHIGASTKEAQERAGVTVARDVLRVLKGETPEFLVNKEVVG
ncbi:MAG: phosphoglycerate dehydrogenase [Thermoplasmata archaeon]|nr:MAG: phosphoglycerate dehydrogenase [Thermoplasmata archaeon]